MNHSEQTSATLLIDSIDQFYRSLTSAKEKASSHLAIPLPLCIVGEMPDVNLYLPEAEQEAPRIFRKKGLYMSQIEISTLSDNGITDLLIESSEGPAFAEYLDAMLAKLPASSTLADEKKVILLQTSAMVVMKDIFAAPNSENIKKGVKAVSGFVYVLMKDPKAYGMLLNLSNHDHYTLQHSMGVATNSIILANKLGIKDEKALIEVGVGGLLHDIGKTKVSPAVINKNGPLNETEWAEMKQHSKWGYEIIKNDPNVGVRAKLAILQHHEEPSGSGYPLNLKNEQIDLYAKIVTIADIFNALTTERSYSEAKAPFEAFQIIKGKLSHKIDQAMFEALVMIYGGQVI